MEFNQFADILNRVIFESSKPDLLDKIANSPKRYIGLFRPTKPKAKILQNLLQSHEIRFGDAFEKIIEQYFVSLGAELLDKRLQLNNGDWVNLDQCFRYRDKICFMEQKVRDDHDSTKKRGQVDNFEKKICRLLDDHEENELVSIFYFIDPDLSKNKKYYSSKLEEISAAYQTEAHIFYGEELFAHFEISHIWEEIQAHLRLWKNTIPDIPEINFDLNAQDTFEEIRDLSPSIYRKLLSDDDIYEQILKTLFPNGLVLQLLLEYFQRQEKAIYASLSQNLRTKLEG